jgi:hypothetical protein
LKNTKNIIYTLSLILQILVGFVFFTEKLNGFDKIASLVILVFNPIFFGALMMNMSSIVEILHMLITILPLFSIYLENAKLIFITLLFLVIQQILIKIFRKCILRKEEKHVLKIPNIQIIDQVVSYLFLLYTILLSYKLGRISKK